MGLQYLILDSDGTLFDSMDTYTRIFSDTLNKPPFNVPVEVTTDFYRQSAGRSLNEQYAEMLRRYGYDVFHVDTLAREFFDEVERTEFRVFSDVQEVLPRLQQCKKSIITGTNTGMTKRRLEKSGLLPFIDCVFGRDDETPNKTAAFAKLRELYGANFTENAVYVGDGTADMELAVQEHVIGIGRIGFFSEEQLRNAGAKDVINNFFGLEELLRKL